MVFLSILKDSFSVLLQEQFVGIPDTFNTSGTCNTTVEGYYAQQLTVYFYENWNLTITFSSDVKQGKFLTAEKVTKYSISNIELYYEINNNLFPNADDSGKLHYCLSPIGKKF